MPCGNNSRIKKTKNGVDLNEFKLGEKKKKLNWFYALFGVANQDSI